MNTEMPDTLTGRLTWIWRRWFAEWVGRLSHHWFIFFLLVQFPFLAIWGVVGVPYGLPLHFREDPRLALGDHDLLALTANSPSFLTHAFTTFFAGLFWLMAAAMNPDEDPLFRKLSAWGEARYLVVRILIVSGAMLFAAAIPISPVVPHVKGYELLRCLAGIAVGLVVFAVYALLSRVLVSPVDHLLRQVTGRKVRYTRSLVLWALLVGLIILLHFFPKLLTVVSLFKLLAGITAFYIPVVLSVPRWRYWVFVFIVFLPLLAGGVGQYKYSFPDMETLYGCPVVLAERQAGPAEQPANPPKGGDCLADAPKTAPLRLSPEAALERYAAANSGSLHGHRLIVVATSGGAYRATFWTALVLDKLRALGKEQSTEGLPGAIRLVTGASGGMVGGAYFASLTPAELTDPKAHSLVDLIAKDIGARQDRQQQIFPGIENISVPRDSLSDVAQQLSNWDSLSLFWPGPLLGVPPVGFDRGRTLQRDWARLGHVADGGGGFTFEHLAGSVAKGEGASLIVSPMIVETGQPLLISDLDLSGIADPNARNTMDFFATFPTTWPSFTVQTAVRMSATFPYVAPAVALPTTPPRRVVDAGYFDNYGMTAALAYLHRPQVREWMRKAGLTGAILVRINAFPVLTDGDAAGAIDKDCREEAPTETFDPFGWLISPLESLGSARERSMVFRSEQALDALKEIYDTDGLELTSIAFENSARSSISWYLPEKDLKCMEQALTAKQGNTTQAIEHLAKAWRGDKGHWDWPAR